MDNSGENIAWLESVGVEFQGTVTKAGAELVLRSEGVDILHGSVLSINQ